MFEAVSGKDFMVYLIIVEFKKHIYIITFDKSNKITGMERIESFDDNTYFLLYGDERDIKR